MINISSDQALARWDTLPITLREALYSDASADFLWKTCEAEHIPARQINNIARVVGYVLMGFIHPEDMAAEVADLVRIPPQTASAIADAVNKRVFAPLRQDLDKIYSPIHPLTGGVKVVKDINAAPAGPKIISQTGNGPLNVGAMPLGNQPPRPVGIPQMPPPVPVKPQPLAPSPMPSAPQKPAAPPLSSPGWSRTTSAQPVVQLSQISTPPPKPTTFGPPHPSAPGKPTPPTMPSGVDGAMGEFERRAKQFAAEKGVGIPPASPLPPTSAGPAPVMLHQDAMFKPAQTGDFHLKLPPESFDMTRNAGVDVGRGAPAVVEFGKITPSPAVPKPPSGPVSTPRPRVVHYTEYKSPSPEVPVKPTAPQGQDKVIFKNYSESEPPMSPKPPSPPSPPPPPRPPQK